MKSAPKLLAITSEENVTVFISILLLSALQSGITSAKTWLIIAKIP
jgi:hypothetical protein